MHGNLQSQEINIKKPAISKIKKSEDSPDLKTIVREAEKNVLQIEGYNANDIETGSGFLFNDKGDIITNAHVIKDAEVIYVRTANARIYHAAVVGIGDKTDIALLRVPELASQDFLPIDKDTSIDIGSDIIALGSPHGFQNTATIGIVSGVDRNFSIDGFDYTNVYQISAQITHGNSGGPLINKDNGHVIGVNSAGTEDGVIGFSIPITEVIDQIETWSNETENDELDFPVTTDLVDQFDAEQMAEDAKYLIDYFFEGIMHRDYINSYTLLGSTMQTKESYADFRESYIRTVELNYSDIEGEITEDNNYKATVNVNIESKLQNEEKTQETKNKYVFTIGFENDQLKIINITNS